MDVILLEKVANLGNLGDRVKVRAGYGRNYLIPFNKAVMATAANVAEFEARRAELEARANESLAAAKVRAEKLAGIESVVIKANAGDEGKLFGSVGVSDIVRALAEAGFEVERSEVRLPEQIRNVGDYDVNIQFHTDVVQPVKVVVEAE